MSISTCLGGSLQLSTTQVTNEERKSLKVISVTDGVQAYVNKTIVDTEEPVPLSKVQTNVFFFPPASF